MLLLRRARVLALDAPLEQAPAQDRAKAEEIVKEMDGLPLALDQAGAYIEETGCSVATYLQRYRQQQTVLLKRRGGTGKEHPDPVGGTWSLSFEQVERQSAVAADLLRCCAFLSPDAIPEELFVEGASQLGPHLKAIAEDATLFDEAIGTLLRFSLIRRNREDNTLSIHRLVQVVLKASMVEPTQRQWAERTVRAVNQAFPYVEFATWPQCQRLIAHAQMCAELIDHYTFAFPEASFLLNQAGLYLKAHALYGQAEPLMKRALEIDEQELGVSHPDTAKDLNNLAVLYHDQGRYEEAEPLMKRALAIFEQVLGPDHPNTVAVRENYDGLLRELKRKKEQSE